MHCEAPWKPKRCALPCLSAHPPPLSFPPRHSFSGALEFYGIEIARKIESYRKRRTTNCFIQIRGRPTRGAARAQTPNGRTQMRRVSDGHIPYTTCQEKIYFGLHDHNHSFFRCALKFNQLNYDQRLLLHHVRITKHVNMSSPGWVQYLFFFGPGPSFLGGKISSVCVSSCFGSPGQSGDCLAHGMRALL